MLSCYRLWIDRYLHHASTTKLKDLYQISNASRIGLGNSNQQIHEASSVRLNSPQKSLKSIDVFQEKMIAIYFHTLKDTPTPRTFQMYPSFVWKSEETSGLPSIQSCKVPLQSHHKSGYGREALESLERLALKSRLETSSFRGGRHPHYGFLMVEIFWDLSWWWN